MPEIQGQSRTAQLPSARADGQPPSVERRLQGDISGGHRGENYYTRDFVAESRWLGLTQYVAQRPGGPAIDSRITRHEGYAKSINSRRGSEKVFGWIKHWSGLRKFKLRGIGKMSAVFGLHMISS